MPAMQSHRLDFCLIPRLKWKIVPPPAVIPPKPARIIRFANHRKDIGLYPRTPVMLGICSVSSIIGTFILYHFFVNPGRQRMREYFFSVVATDEPASEFLRQWSDNLPAFPEDKEGYEELRTKKRGDFWPECPLVPYDVPGWDRSKLKGLDLKKAQKENMGFLDINFIYPH